MVFPEHEHRIGLLGELRQQSQRGALGIGQHRGGRRGVEGDAADGIGNVASASRQRLTDRRFQRFDIIERMLAVAVVRGIAVEPFGPPGIGHHRRSEFRPVGGIDDEAPHGIAPEIDAQKIVGSRLHSYFD